MTLTPQRLEHLLQVQASPLPVRIPRRRIALIAGAGLAVGLALGQAHRWETLPINLAPIETQGRCRFYVPKLENLESLEPVIPPELARRWAPGGDLHHLLAEQQAIPATPVKPLQEAPQEPSECER